jgi:hypothetical protein
MRFQPLGPLQYLLQETIRHEPGTMAEKGCPERRSAGRTGWWCPELSSASQRLVPLDRPARAPRCRSSTAVSDSKSNSGKGFDERARALNRSAEVPLLAGQRRFAETAPREHSRPSAESSRAIPSWNSAGPARLVPAAPRNRPEHRPSSARLIPGLCTRLRLRRAASAIGAATGRTFAAPRSC